MTFVDGVDYVTTSEAIERLGPDVTADTIRGWVRQGRLAPVGRYRGGAWIFRWSDVHEAEYQTRVERRPCGRRRGAPSANLPKAGQLLLTTAARRAA